MWWEWIHIQYRKMTPVDRLNLQTIHVLPCWRLTRTVWVWYVTHIRVDSNNLVSYILPEYDDRWFLTLKYERTTDSVIQPTWILKISQKIDIYKFCNNTVELISIIISQGGSITPIYNLQLYFLLELENCIRARSYLLLSYGE